MNAQNNTSITRRMTTTTRPRTSIIALVALCISAADVWVTWRFWTYGVHALGIGAALIWLTTLWFFFWATGTRCTMRHMFTWTLPLALMMLSVGIYDNIFTTIITLFLLPLSFFLLTTVAAHHAYGRDLWSVRFPLATIQSLLFFARSVARSVSGALHADLHASHTTLFTTHRNALTQIILGLGFFVVIAFFIVIPLLSGADARFATLFADIVAFITQFFAQSLPTKIILTLIGTLFLVGLAHYWRRTDFTYGVARAELSHHRYSIFLGTIVTGISILYVLFIGLQIQSLFMNTLPIDFSTTESLVKTGFWQLFLLTTLNTALYLIIFGKTHVVTQRILGFFTLASLLLVASAGQRIWLYVTNYGLSYEKFYAFYTVLFCTGLFVFFIALFFFRGTTLARIHIPTFLVIATLWGYAVTTILPIEHIIITANLALAHLPHSRIDLGEMRMLGTDALTTVESHFDKILAQSQRAHERTVAAHNDGKPYAMDPSQYSPYIAWLRWIDQTRSDNTFFDYRYTYHSENLTSKKWYERTLSSLLVRRILSDAEIAPPAQRTYHNTALPFVFTYHVAPQNLFATNYAFFEKTSQDGETLTVPSAQGDSNITIMYITEKNTSSYERYATLITHAPRTYPLPAAPDQEAVPVFAQSDKNVTTLTTLSLVIPHTDGSIVVISSDNQNPDVVNTLYGDRAATIDMYFATIARDDSNLIDLLNTFSLTTPREDM